MTISLKNHPSLLYTEDILNICKPLRCLNITTFANARVDHQGHFSSICTSPDFMLNYVDKAYQNADLHVRKQFNDIGNCLMWDAMDCFGKTAEMLDDAARFNFRHIFTIIEPQATYTDFYHFGTHLPHQGMNQVYVSQFDLLKTFVRYFREIVDQSKTLSQAYSISIPPLAQHECQIEMPEPLLDLEAGRRDFLKAMHAQSSKLALAPRQIECAHYLLRGLSAKEIAQQLGLSFRTVEGYIDSLKRRMQVRNKSELITALLSDLSPTKQQ